MAAHCQAVRLQNPFPNGLLIWEELQRLYIRSSHPPDGPHRSPSFRRLQPFPFPRFSHGPTCVCVCVCVCVCAYAHAHTRSVMSNSCDPVDCSPQRSSVRGILQARILEWVAISFSRDLPDPGIIPVSPALAGGFFSLLSHLGSPLQSLTPDQLTRHLLWIQPPRLPTAQLRQRWVISRQDEWMTALAFMHSVWSEPGKKPPVLPPAAPAQHPIPPFSSQEKRQRESPGPIPILTT